jgi:fructosamine-3-kinase
MAEYETTVTADGRPAFRKFSRSGGSEQFRAEADGLAALAATGTVRTPAVLAVSDRELLTERIETGAATARGWRELGAQLAAMHAREQPCFGFTADNFCGDTPQPNPRTDDGHEFFAAQRLSYQGRRAFEAGLLDSRELSALEALGERLPTLVPAQGPALLHGDLWRGNVLFDNTGGAVLIDPACYWGWPEADIAMCALFGGFPAAFYDAWAADARPQPGWRERLPLYQLYHLLNHLNLFGPGYHGQVVSVLRQYR